MFLKVVNTLTSKSLFKIKYALDNEKSIIWVFGSLGIIKILVKFKNFYFNNSLLVSFIKNVSFYNLKKTIGCYISQAKLVNNIFFNINRGYTCFIRIKGVGYKVDFVNSDTLSVSLGYSHNITVIIPYFIKIVILKKRIIVWSYNLCRLQQFCYILYSLKKKDVYNGKGIIQPHLQKKLKIGKISRV